MIVGMREVGLSLSKIGDSIGKPKSTVSMVLKKFSECGFVMPASMFGRLRKLSDQDRRRLKRDLSSNFRIPLAEL